jgi:hypothetical protein
MITMPMDRPAMVVRTDSRSDNIPAMASAHPKYHG